MLPLSFVEVWVEIAESSHEQHMNSDESDENHGKQACDEQTQDHVDAGGLVLRLKDETYKDGYREACD